MNPIPTFSIKFSTSLGSKFMFKPTFSNTSALPLLLVTPLFPCLATGTPAPEITNAAAVLMLKVFILSPPVPQVSTIADEAH